MSNTYSLRTILRIEFQKESIQQLLRRGAEVGCLYSNARDRGQGKTWWNYEEATAYLIEVWREGKLKKDDYCFPEIGIEFKNVSFDLCFKERAGLLAPYFYLNRSGWTKKNVYRHIDSNIDFEKYIRLFLVLVQDFTVVWIKTYEELGDLDLYDEYEWSYPQVREYPILTIPPRFKVDVTMEIPYNHETIYNVLEHGERAGWQFFYQENLNAKQAADAILAQNPLGATVAYVTCSVGDTTYQLTFTLRFNKFFMFTLTPIKAAAVHLEQAVVHALDLCTDLVIFELNTFDARYNYIKSPGDDVK